jgi:hypothetical protein
MITRWLAAHRSLVATATSGTVIAALIATVAVVSGGYTAQRLDLGDSAVWVTNEARQVVGRANTAVRELNTVVTAGSSSLDLLQQGSTVLVVDNGSSSLDILDPATAKVAQTIPLPPVKPSVFLAGDRAVIASNGDMWSMPTAALANFDSTTEPTLALGSGAVASMDAAGAFYSFTPSTGDLSRVDPVTGDAVLSTVNLAAGAPGDRYQLTSVDGRWALFNASTRHLFLAGQETDLSSDVLATDRPVLQQASVGGDRVLLADRRGLLAVPLAGGRPVRLVTGRNGTPAAPATARGCSFAAWGDGTTWRECRGDEPGGRTSTLGGMAADARLQFRLNGTALVLNDARNGAAWAVQQGNELMDNWDELINTVQNQQRVEENTNDTPPEFEKTQMPPVAVDDAFGARPGRTVTLPVLLNDYDPNGDVLVVATLSGLPAGQGRLDLVGNNQQVQLTLPPTASGRLSFGYSINDGRGGTASATVTITVRTEEENSPPRQVRSTHATVQTGGRVTIQVLGDWVDPDGDPIYLTSATAPLPDQAGFTPDGAVVYTDAGSGGERKQVGLVVSDGRDEGTGTLSLTVRPAGSVPIVAEPFVVLAAAGREVTVSPLDHVRGGSAPLRLGSVPAKPDVTITPDFDGGTFRFTSSVVGTHEIEYAVTDGRQTVTGRVRVEVIAPPDTNSTPITVPHTAFIRGQHATLVDVLATDIDPAGGVLLVTGTLNVPPGSGLRVEILDQRILRVTLTKPLESGPVTFSYSVSNGLAQAEGAVTVVEVPEPSRKQAPIAMPDAISVRVGDAIDIPVLANDEHPDGDTLTLDPALAAGLPPGAGLLFASGTVLRYLAPAKTGNFTAVYRVDAPDGQFANAEVRISVREPDEASNNPPVPKTVIARVLAGDTVRIPIPLSGIDPDGDSVQLLGQDTNPEKGAVTAVASDSIEYKSGAYSAGTDTFTYSVVDSLGARATGVVRVGISPRLDGARNPVAVEDEVVVRPGSTVAVRVLGNDSDPDGSALRITQVTPTGNLGSARIDGDLIRVTAPNVVGRFGFVYEIQNDRGGTSSNFLTVVVRTDAPRSRPDARDTVLSLSDVLDRGTVDVDVLAHVFFADGSARTLGLSVLPGFTDAAQVTSSKRIRVTVGDSSQIIPFAVTHPADPGIVSYAFIWVPGYNDALPQLRKGAPTLSVPSESRLTIDINSYVVAVGGKTVRLTDHSTVRATHSNGAGLVSGDDTLVFTSSDKYYGPASISFEVTDGSSATDPAGRTATIVLPITVTPRENQAPTFDGAVIDVEPDQTKVIDLRKLTAYPYPNDQAELAYTVLEPKPTGFTYSLDGQKLTLRALETTPKGSSGQITIGVRDDLSEGKAGRIEMRVVASTRPLAIPAADAAIAPRGRTTVVDVLANDGATNPFPAVPLRVIAVRGLDSAALPAGVAIIRSADSSRLSVSVSADAAPVDTNLQYQVADATGDPDRYAWGAVRISVQDKPDPVTDLRVTGFGDKKLSVSFNPGAANNSPIAAYEITLLDAGSGQPVGTVECQATACDLATPGNGQANGVRVSVAARNALGLSTPTVLADPVWSDVVPPAPTGLAAAPLDGGLRISWKSVTPVGGGTPVRGYVVTVGGTAQGETSATGPQCGGDACSIDVTGLSNGTDTAFTVSARNDAYPALSIWATSAGTGRPFGPARAGGITATGADATGTVTVAWDPFDGKGDPILGYSAQRLSGSTVPSGAQACTVSSPAPGQVGPPQAGGVVDEQKAVSGGTHSVVFNNLLADNGRYSFVVWGYNRAGCAVTPVATVRVRPAPGAVTAVQGGMEQRADAWDYHVTGVTPRADHYNIRAQDGTGPVASVDGTAWPRELLNGAFGEKAGFQLQACAAWGSCGPWSGPLAAPEESVTFAVAGLAYDPAAGRFSWTGGPSNGPSFPATYQCSVPGDPGIPPTDADSPNTCTLPGPPPPAGTVRLTVTVNGHSYPYDK